VAQVDYVAYRFFAAADSGVIHIQDPSTRSNWNEEQDEYATPEMLAVPPESRPKSDRLFKLAL
jgi:hypothetical protein